MGKSCSPKRSRSSRASSVFICVAQVFDILMAKYWPTVFWCKKITWFFCSWAKSKGRHHFLGDTPRSFVAREAGHFADATRPCDQRAVATISAIIFFGFCALLHTEHHHRDRTSQLYSSNLFCTHHFSFMIMFFEKVFLVKNYPTKKSSSQFVEIL